MAARMTSSVNDLGRKPDAPLARASTAVCGSSSAEMTATGARQAARMRSMPARPLVPGMNRSSKTRATSSWAASVSRAEATLSASRTRAPGETRSSVSPMARRTKG